MLERWSRRTADRDEAAELLRMGFPRLALRSTDVDGIAFEHAGVADSRVSIQRLTIQGSGSLVGSTTDPIAAGRVRSGRVTLNYGDTDVDTALPYLRPVGESDLRFDNAALELVVFEPAAFHIHAGRYLAGTSRRLVPPSAASTAPVSAQAARMWQATATYLHTVGHDPVLFDSGLVRDQLFDLAVRVFLASFPVVADGPSTPEARTAAPTAAIRRAVDHVEAHLGEAVTIADLSRVAGLSARALHAGFRRDLGTSPMQHIRDRRLEEVHRRLIEADPAATTVAEIARAFGFTHLSRFAAEYHRRFGLYPRQTLAD